jgi:hypothetical protein
MILFGNFWAHSGGMRTQFPSEVPVAQAWGRMLLGRLVGGIARMIRMGMKNPYPLVIKPGN